MHLQIYRRAKIQSFIRRFENLLIFYKTHLDSLDTKIIESSSNCSKSETRVSNIPRVCHSTAAFPAVTLAKKPVLAKRLAQLHKYT